MENQFISRENVQAILEEREQAQVKDTASELMTAQAQLAMSNEIIEQQEKQLQEAKSSSAAHRPGFFPALCSLAAICCILVSPLVLEAYRADLVVGWLIAAAFFAVLSAALRHGAEAEAHGSD